MELLFFVLEIIGTVAFAVSGALAAIRKKMDIFGVVILGMTTAVAGGIIRDLILGVTPPAAFVEPVYALVAVGVSLIIFIPAIRKALSRLEAVLLVMDSIGLAIFTVIGVRAGMQYHNLFLNIFVGTVTGVGGGVLRDLFAGNRPYIFVKHFYACASIIGALICSLLWNFNSLIAMICGMGSIFVLRILAAVFKWSLPKA
ncbi:MAG: TRIC cation channel family protein [Parasporobacterium sp.]|nr:TRIC cation channel family protein [Parasporobacterium sp.]